MNVTIALQLLGGLLLLAANAFFVASEFSLTRLSQYDENEFSEESSLRRAWEMTQKLELHLTGCQVGITTTSILLGVIAEPGVTKLIDLLFKVDYLGSISTHSTSIVLSVIIINLVHTVWGEQAPTYVGMERSKQIARYFAKPLRWWTNIIYPVLKIGDWLTKATLRIFGIEITRSWMNDGSEGNGDARTSLKSQLADVIRGKGLPEDRQNEILKSLEIGETSVENIIVDKVDIQSLSTLCSFNENHALLRRSMKNRYPLIGENIDDFIGIIYTPEILANFRDLQSGKVELQDISHKKMIVTSDLKISELIDKFQSQNHEMALVSENGKIIGMVTLTDALEEIVGAVEDPLDKVD